ncbi:MAG TPA: sensor histidine kinase [Bacteroidales bacterium]|jgi:signal transduction histidine kinase|nr:sensor histidine kinase [Bacteroidales bacterium]
MKKINFAFVFFFLVLYSAQAQQHLVDSITKELQQPMADSNRALSMMRLAIDYEVVDTAKAYKMYRAAIKFSNEKRLHYQLGRIYQNQSFLYMTTGNYQKSRASLDTAILNYQQSNHPRARRREASAYNDIANGLKVQNELQQSVQYYLKNISLLERIGSEKELVLSYCNLSSVFGDIQEYAKQKEYAQKALSTAKKIGTRQELFMAYFILANSYSVLGDNNSAKTNLDSASVYYIANSNIDMIFTYYLISAQVFSKLNQLDSAIYYLEKSYDVSEKNNYSYGKAESLIQLGAVSIQQKKYDSAERYLLNGMKNAKSIGYFNMLYESYKYLSDLYAVTGRYKQAYESFQKYTEFSDSLINMDSKKYATELEKKYESVKKDHQLELQRIELHRKNIINLMLILTAIILLIISLLSYRNIKIKQKLQQQRIIELETEKQLEATEAVLKGEEQERTRLAKDLHDGLGGMLSGIKYSFTTMKGNLVMTPENHQAFERSMDMLDSSIREMRRVAHNMMPEALIRFGLDTALNDFCNDINQSGALKVNYQSLGMENISIDSTVAITLYRIVQELINNVMKHAQARTAIVQVTKSNNILSVTVEDDGKGFDTGILKTNKGIGWASVQNRVEFLKAKLDIRSKAGEGTSVQIEVNI